MEPCVLIPTYNNARTLEGVVRDARMVCEHVLVVDDGTTDGSDEILRRLADQDDHVTVVRHAVNRGKGAALRTGLAEARRRGFSHAISLDSDGQHPAHHVHEFLEAARENPTALILGDRDLVSAGAGKGSRWGRVNSNFWTWVATGLRLPDTQSGYRCYPLESIAALHLTCTGYDLEIEVLVKAAWIGVPVRSIPTTVRYFQGEERVSHLRPFLDFLRIGWLNTRLVTARICLPAPFLGLRSQGRYHRLPRWRRFKTGFVELFFREPGSPARISVSVGVGLFMGITPFWGFQIMLAIAAAHTLRLNKPITVLASNISFPLMIPPILYASLVLGRYVVGRDSEDLSLATIELQSSDFWAWVLGSFLLATVVGLLGAATTFVLLKVFRGGRPVNAS